MNLHSFSLPSTTILRRSNHEIPFHSSVYDLMAFIGSLPISCWVSLSWNFYLPSPVSHLCVHWHWMYRQIWFLFIFSIVHGDEPSHLSRLTNNKRNGTQTPKIVRPLIGFCLNLWWFSVGMHVDNVPMTKSTNDVDTEKRSTDSR